MGWIKDISSSLLNSEKILKLAEIAVYDENPSLKVLNVVKGQTELAYGGYLYHLTINVQGVSRKMIKRKVVWKGKTRQPLDFQELSPEAVEELPSDELKPELESKLKKFEELVLQTVTCRKSYICPAENMRRPYIEISLYKCVPRGTASYIKFTEYNLTMAVTEEYPHNPISEKPFIIKGRVLETKWILTVEKEMRKSISPPKIKKPKKLPPPCPSPSDSEEDEPFVGGPLDLDKFDLCNPQVPSTGWFAVEDHNYKKDTNFKFVDVVKGSCQIVAGEILRLTIRAMDGTNPKIFTTEAWSENWVKFVKLAPLVEMEDSDYCDSLKSEVSRSGHPKLKRKRRTALFGTKKRTKGSPG